jgi:hypothetical protein
MLEPPQIDGSILIYFYPFAFEGKQLFMVGFILFDGNLPLAVDHAVPWKNMLFTHRMKNPYHLAGSARTAGRPGMETRWPSAGLRLFFRRGNRTFSIFFYYDNLRK